MNPSQLTTGTVCEFIKKELTGLYPEREIQSLTDMIFQQVMGIARHEIHIMKEKIIESSQLQQIEEITQELSHYKPIQYILGYADFFSMKLRVTPAVLIPRPETEELVNWIILDHINGSPLILDVGTGSGCIAIALKKNIPRSQIHACDISRDALSLAEENAGLIGTDVRFFQQDILDDVTSQNDQPHPAVHFSGSNDQNGNFRLYDIIVSNPPYIPLKEKNALPDNVSAYEPTNALFVPDEDPLKFYRHIALFGSEHLKKNGHIYFEIHENSGEEIRSLLEDMGYRDILIRRDINEKERMIKCVIR